MNPVETFNLQQLTPNIEICVRAFWPWKFSVEC
jgi:hypothetical protein